MVSNVTQILSIDATTITSNCYQCTKICVTQQPGQYFSPISIEVDGNLQHRNPYHKFNSISQNVVPNVP